MFSECIIIVSISIQLSILFSICCSVRCQVATVFSKGFYNIIQCKYVRNSSITTKRSPSEVVWTAGHKTRVSTEIYEIYEILCFRGGTIRMCGRCENYVPISSSGTCNVMLLWKCFGVIGYM